MRKILKCAAIAALALCLIGLWETERPRLGRFRERRAGASWGRYARQRIVLRARKKVVL